MSIQQRRTQNDSDSERFVALSAPSPMTDEKLAAMQDPVDQPTDDEVAVFAVAHQSGVIQSVAEQRECEAIAVLYLTADGEQSVERWYHNVSGFGEMRRAFAVDADRLEPTGENGRRFAPIARIHPEVQL